MKIKKIYQTKPKLILATWQSIHRLGKKWFDQFDMVIGDECHLFKANCLTSIMEKLDECPIRIGMTGTLDDSKINELTLEGLFGPIFKSTTTAELIEKKVLADFNVECLVLKYSDEERKVKRSYDDELNFIVSHPKRNALIRQLVTKLDGNVLVLFQFVEKHGKELLELIKKSTNRSVFYISGEIKPAERERIRKAIGSTMTGVLLEFPYGTILVPFDDEILLSDGSYKKARNITHNDDIDNGWIEQNKDKYKYL